jgi:antitoxin VapB
MTRSALFRSNRSQAMRLAKEIAFPAGVREVVILRDGVRRVIVPAMAVWDDVLDAPGVDLGVRVHPRAEVGERAGK